VKETEVSDVNDADGDRSSSQVAGMLMVALIALVLDLMEALVLMKGPAGALTRTAP
jgi:hypothetical protein